MFFGHADFAQKLHRENRWIFLKGNKGQDAAKRVNRKKKQVALLGRTEPKSKIDGDIKKNEVRTIGVLQQTKQIISRSKRTIRQIISMYVQPSCKINPTLQRFHALLANCSAVAPGSWQLHLILQAHFAFIVTAAP